jgi:hypothetical protein
MLTAYVLKSQKVLGARSYRWCTWVLAIVAWGLKNAGTGELPRKRGRDPASGVLCQGSETPLHAVKQATNAASIAQLTIVRQHTMFK